MNINFLNNNFNTVSFGEEKKKNVYVIRRKPGTDKKQVIVPDTLSDKNTQAQQNPIKENRAQAQKAIEAQKASVLYKSEKPTTQTSLVPLKALFSSSRRDEYVNTWSEAGLIEVQKNEDGYLIDTGNEKNAKFLKKIMPRIKTSVPKYYFYRVYGLKESKLIEQFVDGRMVPLGFEDCPDLSKDMFFKKQFLTDLENEKNKKTMKLLPKRTDGIIIDDFAKRKTERLSIELLEQQGFGSADYLFELIKEGKIKGTIKQDEADGTLKVNAVIESVEDIAKLRALRDENPDVITIPRLAKKLGVEKSVIREAIYENKLDIIPNFIFKRDSGVAFIDLGKDKNKAFVESFIASDKD